MVKVSVIGQGTIRVNARSREEALNRMQKLLVKETKKWKGFHGLAGIEIVHSGGKIRKEKIEFQRLILRR